MRVLVTGGAGYIGREVVRKLAARGDTAIAFDQGFPAEMMETYRESDRVRLAPGDITDLATVIATMQTEKPDHVIHCAAIVGVLYSIGSPSTVIRVNVQGSIHVFEAMRLCGIRRVVHMSSEEVYGEFERPVADEEHPQRPRMPYGISKLAVEQLGRTYRDLYGIECINLRTSWVYGVGLPRPRPPTTFLDAALEGRPHHLPFGADAIIDYTYMEDVTDGILAALDTQAPEHDVYNLASGVGTRLSDLVDLVREMIPGSDLSVAQGSYRFADQLIAPVKGALDVTRAARDLGFRPAYDLRRGFEAYIAEWHKRYRKTRKAP